MMEEGENDGGGWRPAGRGEGEVGSQRLGVRACAWVKWASMGLRTITCFTWTVPPTCWALLHAPSVH